MYVLMLYDKPIAVAERFERLSEAMASPRFRAIDQAHMAIVSNVEVLK
jgi:hypothetical protein